MKEKLIQSLIGTTFIMAISLIFDLIFKNDSLTFFFEKGILNGIGILVLKFAFWFVIMLLIILFSKRKGNK